MQIGLSPCPNDTFIFHAILNGLVNDYEGPGLEACFHDVEKLNHFAIQKKFPVTKISLGIMPLIKNDYRLLGAGAALGWGCGPLVVARRGITLADLGDTTIGIPGRHTTANLLLDSHGGFRGKRKEYVFNEIMPAIADGEINAGIIIHEGRFTYPDWGLDKILDMGEWWEKEFNLPLPLGAIAIRRDVNWQIAQAIENGIRSSLQYGWRHPDDSKEFVAAYAQELDEKIRDAHIRTFVTEHSLNLGETGRNAIRVLLGGVPATNHDDLFFNQKSE